VLASGSPRRRVLLEDLGFHPVVHVSEVPEHPESGESPRAYTERLAELKARDVAGRLSGSSRAPDWIVAADTIVVHEDEILEKPGGAAEAREMLARLSGTTHEVLTSFCLLERHDERGVVRTVRTEVDFRELGDETIERYIATGEPMDKAGGYGIQDLGGALVREIRGSFYAVVGLPIGEVVELLVALGAIEGFPFAPPDD
jgi:septum formation protein